MGLSINGIYPVEGCDFVHLIEVELDDPASFNWNQVTQEIAGQPRSNWQVPYDEQKIGNRWVFFFHYLDLDRPLITSEAKIVLPLVSPLPPRLQGIQYAPP